MKKLLTATLMGVLVLGMFTPVLAQETAELERVVVETEIPAAPEPLEEAIVPEPVPEPEISTSTSEVTVTEEEAPAPVLLETVSVETIDEPTVELIVKFKEDAANLELASGRRISNEAIAGADAVLEERLLGANSAVVSIDEDQSVEETISILESDPSVEYAEPNHARTFEAVNDPRFGDLWALENTGQTLSVVNTSGTAGADIDAEEAWELSLGTSTIVAVIDNGVLYTHEDLAGNMWDGSACKSETGAALGGCSHGYDFSSSTAGDLSPLPEATSTTATYHGTHVAGTIAASMNNATGTVGVAPSAKIMALRFGLDVASEVKAIDFAIQNGAKIINASFGGTGSSTAEYQAIQRFEAAGGIFIAAAGNGGLDTVGDDDDVTPTYPASYDLANIVSVAATGQNDELAAFSNFGTATVDLGAPGRRILSTSALNGVTASYDYLSGTSMAAPHVAGVAALAMARYPGASVTSIRTALIEGGDAIASLSGKTVSGKRLNALGALEYLSADAVAPVITLTGPATLSLTWGSTYSEQGATATDDTDVSVSVTIGGDAVDTARVGTYVVTYDATDLAGNHALQVTRTVTVTEPAARRSGGGGGGGGGKNRTTTETNPSRDLFAGATSYASMTLEQRTLLLQTLLTLLAQLQAQLAALQAQGL